MAKATPGPWHWHCSRTLMHLHDAHGRCFAEVSMRRSLMHEADANLIAAAPELYAQLEFAVKLLGGLPGFAGTAQIESMRAALAKATQP